MIFFCFCSEGNSIAPLSIATLSEFRHFANDNNFTFIGLTSRTLSVTLNMQNHLPVLLSTESGFVTETGIISQDTFQRYMSSSWKTLCMLFK